MLILFGNRIVNLEFKAKFIPVHPLFGIEFLLALMKHYVHIYYIVRRCQDKRRIASRFQIVHEWIFYGLENLNASNIQTRIVSELKSWMQNLTVHTFYILNYEFRILYILINVYDISFEEGSFTIRRSYYIFALVIVSRKNN